MKAKVLVVKEYEYIRPTMIVRTSFETTEYPEYRETIKAGTVLDFSSKKDALAFIAATGNDCVKLVNPIYYKKA